jgi:hypothetical protein
VLKGELTLMNLFVKSFEEIGVDYLSITPTRKIFVPIVASPALGAGPDHRTADLALVAGARI